MNEEDLFEKICGRPVIWRTRLREDPAIWRTRLRMVAAFARTRGIKLMHYRDSVPQPAAPVLKLRAINGWRHSGRFFGGAAVFQRARGAQELFQLPQTTTRARPLAQAGQLRFFGLLAYRYA